MTETIKPEEIGSQEVVTPEGQFTPTEISLESLTQEEALPPPPSVPMVVVPQTGGGMPKWFYFIFLLTLIIFLVVTALLVNSLRKQQQQVSPTKVLPSPTPIPMITSVVPTAASLPSPTTSPLPATDSAILRLRELSASDEVGALEKEINETDFSEIEEELVRLDREVGFTP